MVESAAEIVGDNFGAAALYVVALQEVDEAAIFEEGDARRGGRVGKHVIAGFGYCVFIYASEDGDEVLGAALVLYGYFHAGSGVGGSAAAYRIDDD